MTILTGEIFGEKSQLLFANYFKHALKQFLFSITSWQNWYPRCPWKKV